MNKAIRNRARIRVYVIREYAYANTQYAYTQYANTRIREYAIREHAIREYSTRIREYGIVYTVLYRGNWLKAIWSP
mgnify:CR=1 FL=1